MASFLSGWSPSVASGPAKTMIAKKPVGPPGGFELRFNDISNPDLENILEKALRLNMTDCMTNIMHRHHTTNHAANPINNFKFVVAGGRAFEYMISPTLQSQLQRTTYNGQSLYSLSFDYDLYVYPAPDFEGDVRFNPTYYNSIGFKHSGDGEYTKLGYASVSAADFLPYQTLLTGLNNYYSDIAYPGSEHLPKIFRQNIKESLKQVDPAENFIDFKQLDGSLNAGNAFVGRFSEHNLKPMWSIDFRIPLKVPNPKSESGQMYIDLSLIDLKNMVRDVVRIGGVGGAPQRYRVKVSEDGKVVYDKEGKVVYEPDAHGHYYKLLAPENTYISERTFPNIGGVFDHRTCMLSIRKASNHYITNEIANSDKKIFAYHPFIMANDNGWLVGDKKTGTALFTRWTTTEPKMFDGDFDSLYKTILSVFGIEKIEAVDLPFTLDEKELRTYRTSQRHVAKYIKRLIRCVCILILSRHLTDGPYTKSLGIPPLSFSKLYSFFNIQHLRKLTWLHNYNEISGCIKIKSKDFKIMYEFLKDGLIEIFFCNQGFQDDRAGVYEPCNKKLLGNLNLWDEWTVLRNSYEKNMGFYNYWNGDKRITNPYGPIESDNANAFRVDASLQTYIATAKKWTRPDEPSPWPSWTHLWETDAFILRLIETHGFSRNAFMLNIEGIMNNVLSTPKDREIANYLYHLYRYSYNWDTYKGKALFNFPSKESDYFIAWRHTFPQSFIWKDDYDNFKRGFLEQAPIGCTVYPMKCLSASMNAYYDERPVWSTLQGPLNALTTGFSLYKIKSKGKGCLFINKASYFQEYELLMLPWAGFRVKSKKWKFVQHLNLNSNFAGLVNGEDINQYRRMYVIELEEINENYDDLKKVFVPKLKPASSSSSAVAFDSKSVWGPPASSIASKAKVVPAAGPCDPAQGLAVPTTIAEINTFIDTHFPEHVGHEPNLILQGTILERARANGGGNHFNLPRELVERPVIYTIGDGTCGVHAFLLAVSDSYRKLDDVARGGAGQLFRKVMMPEVFKHVPIDQQKAHEYLCNSGQYLLDQDIAKLVNHFGLNLLVVNHQCTPDGVYQDPVILDLPDLLHGADFIVFEGSGGNHFSAVLTHGMPPGGIKDIDNSKFIIPYSRENGRSAGREYYNSYKYTLLTDKVYSGHIAPPPEIICNQEVHKAYKAMTAAPSGGAAGKPANKPAKSSGGAAGGAGASMNVNALSTAAIPTFEGRTLAGLVDESGPFGKTKVLHIEYQILISTGEIATLNLTSANFPNYFTFSTDIKLPPIFFVQPALYSFEKKRVRMEKQSDGTYNLYPEFEDQIFSLNKIDGMPPGVNLSGKIMTYNNFFVIVKSDKGELFNVDTISVKPVASSVASVPTSSVASVPMSSVASISASSGKAVKVFTGFFDGELRYTIVKDGVQTQFVPYDRYVGYTNYSKDKAFSTSRLPILLKNDINISLPFDLIKNTSLSRRSSQITAQSTYGYWVTPKDDWRFTLTPDYKLLNPTDNFLSYFLINGVYYKVTMTPPASSTGTKSRKNKNQKRRKTRKL